MKKKTIKIEGCRDCPMRIHRVYAFSDCQYYEKKILDIPKPTFCKVDRIIVCERERK